WSIVFAADGNSLFSACGDNTLRRIDLASEKDKILETYGRWVRSLARHERTLAVGTVGGLVHLWDTDTEKEMENEVTIELRGELPNKIAFDAKGQMLAEGGSGAHLALYAVSGELKFALEGHKCAEITSLAFPPDGKLLVSVGG